MAMSRLMASRLQQTLASQRQAARLAPSSYGLLSRFSAEAAGGQEVVVESQEGKKKKKRRWSSLLPRRLQRRRDSLWRNQPPDFAPPFNEIFHSGVGSALLEATQNINRMLDNLGPSGIVGQMKEKDDSYKLRYEVPGLAKEDLKITIDDGVLSIAGEHEEEKGDESDDEFWSAKSYEFYNASIVLPDDAKHEDIKAELKNGVLTIVIPKDETKAKQVKEVHIH